MQVIDPAMYIRGITIYLLTKWLNFKRKDFFSSISIKYYELQYILFILIEIIQNKKSSCDETFIQRWIKEVCSNICERKTGPYLCIENNWLFLNENDILINTHLSSIHYIKCSSTYSNKALKVHANFFLVCKYTTLLQPFSLGHIHIYEKISNVPAYIQSKIINSMRHKFQFRNKFTARIIQMEHAPQLPS